MKDVITHLIEQAQAHEGTAKLHRRMSKNHILATKFEKLARHYRTAAKLLALIYPQK